MKGSTTPIWIVPSQGGKRRRGESITEPSGKGAFAEAMRELIAQLTPLPQGVGAAENADEGHVATKRRARHLSLVR